jgi:peptidoglycan hydrolase-like protein with peptidoglycan-binding domain
MLMTPITTRLIEKPLAAKVPASSARIKRVSSDGERTHRRNSACACGGGCPRCEMAGLSSTSAGHATLASPQRPEVVVEPKTSLDTPAFAANSTLVEVMRGKRLLSFGAVGDSVRLVQEALIASEVRRPSTPGTRLPQFGVDGIFGRETKRAVEEFQSEYGIAVDGIVGPQTLYWLDETFKDYTARPSPEPQHKIPARFPGENKTTLQKPSSFDLTMKTDNAVGADTTMGPKISAKATFTATVAGQEGKVFFVQNVRRVERKVHWQRATDCTSECEQARAFVGKAQGLDTSLPYNSLPRAVTPEAQTFQTDDQPSHEAESSQNPKGDFRAGDVVHLFAHDQFRMFLAFGPAKPLFDFSEFDALGFIDWEWRGKVRFTFDGSTWSAGSVQSRIDPSPTSMIQTRALIFLGPLYTGGELDRNLRSSRTKVDEKPDSW